MKWFKHDSDAHRDAKLRKVIMNYGIEGYGLYWYCLEQIARSVTAEKYTFELEHDAEIIAFDTGISTKRVEEMMHFMVHVGLFENTSGIITCLKLAKRLDSSMTSNPAMRDLIRKVRGSSDRVMIESGHGHDGIMSESGQSHDPVMQDKTRLDEKRKEKKKGRKSPRFAPPSVDEVRRYCLERNNRVDPQAFVDFYEAKGWMVGKNKMKSWQAAVRTWEKRDTNNVKGSAKQGGYMTDPPGVDWI